MKVSIRDRLEAVGPAAWDGLVAASRLRSPFLSWVWQCEWARTFAADRRLEIRCVEDGAGNLVAILPLYESSPGSRQAIGGADVSDYLDLISVEGREEEAWMALLQSRTAERVEWALHAVPETSPTVGALPPLAAACGLTASPTVEERCPVLALPSSWETYLASLSGKHRHELLRKMRRLERDAPDAHASCVSAPADINARLADFLVLHRSSRVGKARFMDGQMERFFRSALTAFAERGAARLWFLDTLSGPIAAFVDLWTKLAAALRADPNFTSVHGYDLMNEWAGMDPANPSANSTLAGQAIVLQANHDVMVALRSAGDNTPLYFEWDHFSGAWDAVANNIGQLMDLARSDPAGTSKVSVHCYFDRDSSGSHFVWATEAAATGLAPPGLSTNVDIIAQRVGAVAALAASKGVALHIGEIGWGNDSPVGGGNDDYVSWNHAAEAALTFCRNNNIEVHAWGSGPNFGTTYGYNPSPSNIVTPANKDFTSAGFQATQTVIIEKYTGFSGTQPTTYRLDAPFGITPYAPPGNPIPGFKARYNGKITSTLSFTPSAKLPDGSSAGGTFAPSTITMAPGDNGLTVFSYTPASAFAAITIALTSANGLIDPPGVGCSSATDFFTTFGSVAPNVYATRRLVNTYAGPAFRLQRASDNAQMDFYFNNRGDLPRQAIQDWASSRQISIVTWYDQSGNTNHAVFGANQIALLLVDADSYPSVLWLVRASTFVNSPSIGAAATTIYADASTSGGDIATQDNFTETFRISLGAFSVDDNGGPLAGGSVAFAGAISNVWQELAGTYSSLYAINNLKAYLNGSVVSQASIGQFINNSGGNSYNIGDFRFGDQHFSGSMRTQIVHYAEYQAANISALHTARSTYFSTPLPDSLTAVNPTLSGFGPRNAVAGKTSQPFFGVTVSDTNVSSPMDSVTITLTGSAGGTLTGTGLSGSGPYTLAADTAANITTKLRALVYTPVGGGGASETLAVVVSSSAGTNASSSATVVSVLAAAPAETPFAAPSGSFSAPTKYKGVNISGGENSYPAANNGPGGTSSFNYAYPFNTEIDYWASKGMTCIRMPLRGRRMQPASYGALDDPARTDETPQAYRTYSVGSKTNLLAVRDVLTYARSKGIWVALDIHDFGSITDTLNGNVNRVFGVDAEGTAQLVDLWTRLATVYKNFDNVMFDLQNEPVGMTAAQWFTAATAVINAIAAVTTAVPILLEGGGNFSGAHDWVSGGNAAAWAGYTPPAGMKIIFEPHQYLDSDDSGTHSTVVSGKGTTVLAAFTSWARTNGFKALLGECGWSFNDSQVSGGVPSTEGSAIMAHMSANSDVWVGWTYWLGGTNIFYAPWNGPSNYLLAAVPAGYPSGPFTDAPQTSILMGNLN